MPSKKASDASEFVEVLIESNDGSNSADLRLGVQNIDYYEDIFSPTITAKIVVTTTGNAFDGKGIYQGLPLRGGERVSLNIKGNAENPGLDFSKNTDDYLYVSSITNIISDPQVESFVLNLCSREAITNETTRVVKKYPSSVPISGSAETILTELIQTRKPIDADQSSNKYGFIGNNRKPFTVLTWLASKAAPESGIAGYVFYQTQDGYKFKSLDKLITQEPKDSFYYTTVTDGDAHVGSTFGEDKIIMSYITNRNQNMLEKLRLGSYCSHRAYFDPLTFKVTPPEKRKFTIDDYGKVKNLGKKLQLPKISENSDKTLGEIPTRIITGILDRGTTEKGVNKDLNADPLENQSQSLLRYNSLFTQTLTITIPSNTNLRAGDIIECSFPATSTTKNKEFDDEQSGLYMIKELCHQFNSEGSYTSAKLIRDTFGQYGTNNKEN
jgi:hypothetical protein